MEDTLERVILLDEQGEPCGAAPKNTVHHADTPLHLAFSCHVTDDSGRVLMTRRSLAKRAWPGTWTNAFCGHPQPFEPVPDAVARRADDELGLALADLRLVLPDFRYRAVDASGVVENEVCPVYTARAVGEPVLDPEEAMDARWVEPAELAAALQAAPWAFSPWLVLQAREMSATDGRISAAAWRREQEL
ncbi:isopentenyl-diphosphate Delta-isomerase [Microbacterium marinilacus]|uniref:Isopentenyl-diphosphate Delta-isomerase n=1 Tax=Microbacterium marinilacus TaxID=415209 RepID=A0ABP7BJY1_9MICO|nr:isopentenyl-diphosphate Delta-isomerase [Microbacterium marinilacus]MBY0687692.1 isopentenyl-diphosphate Delta-isomerase [Microbacterium marinilacus]